MPSYKLFAHLVAIKRAEFFFPALFINKATTSALVLYISFMQETCRIHSLRITPIGTKIGACFAGHCPKEMPMTAEKWIAKSWR